MKTKILLLSLLLAGTLKSQSWIISQCISDQHQFNSILLPYNMSGNYTIDSITFKTTKPAFTLEPTYLLGGTDFSGYMVTFYEGIFKNGIIDFSFSSSSPPSNFITNYFSNTNNLSNIITLNYFNNQTLVKESSSIDIDGNKISKEYSQPLAKQNTNDVGKMDISRTENNVTTTMETDFTFDANGNPTSFNVTNASQSAQYFYNSNNLIEKIVYSNGNEVNYKWSKKDKSAVGDIVNSKIDIYPNPAQNSFDIRCEKESTVSIYDMNGNLISTFSPSLTHHINIELEQAIYTLKIVDSSGHEQVKKLSIIN